MFYINANKYYFLGVFIKHLGMKGSENLTARKVKKYSNFISKYIGELQRRYKDDPDYFEREYDDDDNIIEYLTRKGN